MEGLSHNGNIQDFVQEIDLSNYIDKKSHDLSISVAPITTQLSQRT